MAFWPAHCEVWFWELGVIRTVLGGTMLWTIAVLLVILWFLGMVSSYTVGGFVHILLLLAVAAVLIRIIQGRNPI